MVRCRRYQQVVEVPDASWVPDITRLGEWRDVMPAANIRVRVSPLLPTHRQLSVPAVHHGALRAAQVRFPTADFVGGIITHCHILEHEDGGMMGQFMIHGVCFRHMCAPCSA